MPHNTKDNNGGKSQSAKSTAANGTKRSDKGPADTKPGSPAGSQNGAKKKTTP